MAEYSVIWQQGFLVLGCDDVFFGTVLPSLFYQTKPTRWLQPVTVERHTRDIALLAHGTRGSETKVIIPYMLIS
jgi:hypothetical protein